jgi:RNA polymerase sigma-70 factor (ECF subfamily)
MPSVTRAERGEAIERLPGIVQEDRAAIEARLLAVFEAGRTAWPGTTLSDVAFFEHVARHAATPLLAWLDAAHTTDLYLACAVLHRDEAALGHLDRVFITAVRDYVIRTTVDYDLIEETKQQLRERVALGKDGPAKIGEYSGRGPLGGWLRVASVRIALNLLRAARSKVGASEQDEGILLDPELAYLKVRAGEVFQQAFVRAVEGLAPRERTLLRLHYVEGMTLDQLSKMFRTPRSTIARRVDEVRDAIFSQTERDLRDRHRLSPSEVASLIRAARSQVQLTLSKILS